MAKLGDHLKNRKVDKLKPGMINEKTCPFQSTESKQVPCDPQCKLYKHNSHGYECPIQELSAISYALRSFQQPKK